MHWSWFSALGNSALILPALACVLALLATHSDEGRHDARRWLLASGLAFGAMALSKIAFYGWGVGIHALRLASPSGHATLAMAFWPVFLALLAPNAAPHPPCGHLLPAGGEKDLRPGGEKDLRPGGEKDLRQKDLRCAAGAEEMPLRPGPASEPPTSPRLRGEGPLRAAKQGEGTYPHWRTAAATTGFALGLLCSLSRVVTHAHTVSETIVGATAGALVALATLRELRTERLPMARGAFAAILLLGALALWSRWHPLRLPTEHWLARAGAHLAGRAAPVSKGEWLRTGAVVDQRTRR
ncbi:phosphatase PAP2 family protein [Lysobacter niabensis]|uniref:phosphatase PAP2 family protein n=1 Tax=Agrilutibacter niabensis TaxID=380628 RepID=UPI00361C598E